MWNKIKKWLGYYNGRSCIYTGIGYLQGAGFDIEADVFEVRRFGIKIVKNITVTVQSEWLSNLRERL